MSRKHGKAAGEKGKIVHGIRKIVHGLSGAKRI